MVLLNFVFAGIKFEQEASRKVQDIVAKLITRNSSTSRWLIWD
jgi:hypothetical protein